MFFPRFPAHGLPYLSLWPLQDGVFVRGLYLEGAGWDKSNSCLVEAKPMQMVCPIPTIHFKPVENRKKMAKSEWNSLLRFTNFFLCSTLFIFMWFFCHLCYYVIMFIHESLSLGSCFCFTDSVVCLYVKVCTCVRVTTTRCVLVGQAERLLLSALNLNLELWLQSTGSREELLFSWAWTTEGFNNHAHTDCKTLFLCKVQVFIV